ncbi:MAG: LPS assembly lipoprotein LptE [Bacteroidota bacterium]|nr:LPS assembly lipoprotein LptE [Bacteroidota bacterium]
MIKIIKHLFIIFSIYGCGVYSFTGASISPEVKTISFQNFFNNSPLGPSNMSVLFNEKIKDYFERNTSLTIVDENGDLEIEGTIEDFSLSPVAPTAEGGRNSQYFTGLTRLTVRVNATYFNKFDNQFNYENKSFSFFKDFNQNTEELSSNEQEFLDEIFDQIILDIFNASVANW